MKYNSNTDSLEIESYECRKWGNDGITTKSVSKHGDTYITVTQFKPYTGIGHYPATRTSSRMSTNKEVGIYENWVEDNTVEADYQVWSHERNCRTEAKQINGFDTLSEALDYIDTQNKSDGLVYEVWLNGEFGEFIKSVSHYMYKNGRDNNMTTTKHAICAFAEAVGETPRFSANLYDIQGKMWHLGSYHMVDEAMQESMKQAKTRRLKGYIEVIDGDSKDHVVATKHNGNDKPWWTWAGEWGE